jgi:hypothetical protein
MLLSPRFASRLALEVQHRGVHVNLEKRAGKWWRDGQKQASELQARRLIASQPEKKAPEVET